MSYGKFLIPKLTDVLKKQQKKYQWKPKIKKVKIAVKKTPLIKIFKKTIIWCKENGVMTPAI